jgi:Rrf2 family transcriptional regulator, iron-sulfur cluster assembly transcription factor
MNFTTKSRYALRAVVDIAIHQGKTGLPIRRMDIGNREGVSQDYLEQILVRLREARIVESVRGPGGGYRLIRTPESITVWDVISAAEDHLDNIPCNADEEPACGRWEHCLVRPVWKHLKQTIRQEMQGFTIADIIEGRGEALAGDVESSAGTVSG